MFRSSAFAYSIHHPPCLQTATRTLSARLPPLRPSPPGPAASFRSRRLAPSRVALLSPRQAAADMLLNGFPGTARRWSTRTRPWPRISSTSALRCRTWYVSHCCHSCLCCVAAREDSRCSRWAFDVWHEEFSHLYFCLSRGQGGDFAMCYKPESDGNWHEQQLPGAVFSVGSM